MREGGFVMKKQDRQAAAAIFTAACVLAVGAFAPLQPRAAWWCTAFSVAPAEAAECVREAEGQVEFRFRLADWLRSLAG